MKIIRIAVYGYKSIQEETELFLRDNLTCFIGANEHGKTNLLNAIHKIGEQKLDLTDINTVLSNKGVTGIPKIIFDLRFEEDDRLKVSEMLGIKLKQDPTVSSDPATVSEQEYVKVAFEKKVFSAVQSKEDFVLKLTIDSNGRIYSFDDCENIATIHPELVDLFENSIPKAYLFAPSNQIADSVTLDELNQRTSIEFEGLLKLAGFWDKKEQLFNDGANSSGLRKEASRNLTAAVKKLWSQGKSDYNFHFDLQTGPRLCLTIEDNTGNYDSPSHRSLGFKAFFSFYLAIYAHTNAISPSGYIFLFDEPEIHLHPEAQKDLLRELRNLGTTNQVVFATHSPFMIDKNNLLSTVVIRKQTKDDKPKGTKAVHKPYLNNWLAVRESLGVLMGDTLLYTNKSLFVEGTSDRLFTTAILEKYKEKLQIDMNYLSILDGDQKKEAIGIARILLSEGRHLVLMVDGDKGGEELAKQYKQLAKELGMEDSIEILNLQTLTKSKKPVSIEDLLPLSIFVEAVNKYIQEIFHKDQLKDLQKDLEVEEKTKTRGKAFVEIVSTKLGVGEDKIAKTTVADFFGQIIAEKETIDYPDGAKLLAKELKRLLNLE